MKELAVLLKAMNIYAHNAHNLVARIVFMQDHEFLGELYAQYDKDYDDVIERIIGLQGSEGLDLVMVHAEALMLIKDLPSSVNENKVLLQEILKLEQRVCATVENMIKTIPLSEGTKQLIGEICNQSEIRQYKIKQRIK